MAFVDFGGHWTSEEGGEACWTRLKQDPSLLAVAVVVGACLACLAAYLILGRWIEELAVYRWKERWMYLIELESCGEL